MYPQMRLTENLQVPTYFLVISLTVTICIFWWFRRLRKSALSLQTGLDLSLVIMISGLLGSRLFHIAYENYDYYQINPWKAFFLWDGGFVFYGGVLTASISAWIFLRVKDPARIFDYFDLAAPVVAVCYAIGRLGCFFAGCCYGKSCDLPWAINNRHPTQLYATFWEIGVLLVLKGLESIPRAHRKPKIFSASGSLFFIWMILHGAGRLIMETFRDDFRGPALGLSISSWISLLLIALGALFLYRPPQIWKKFL